MKSAVCWALPDLVDNLTSNEKSDSGMPASVVVATAISTTLPASSLTSTSTGSQLKLTGTYSSSAILTVATAGPPCR